MAKFNFVFALVVIFISSHRSAAVPCNHSDVRLVGGCHSLEGRVEICIHGEWGTVCDDFWDDVDAQVVCSQLGHPNRKSLGFSRALYGMGNGSIFLDDVHCVGNESRLVDCPRRPAGQPDCFHLEDASVSCIKADCIDGDVRLAEGSFYEGRVEVCQDGLWGTVCDDLWGEEDAFVVCGQLGLMSEDAVAVDFGPGCGPIFYDNVECTRIEKKLGECSRAIFGDCYHDQDAGVRCALTTVNFLPFGQEVGDLLTSDENPTSLGPFNLSTPVVYYLRHEFQIKVSITGQISFQQNPDENPRITPQWRINYPEITLYARVTEDPIILDRLMEILVEGNPKGTIEFFPSLAFVVTWHGNSSEKGTLQAIVSTDGVMSFLTFLFDDEHGVGILEQEEILNFEAADSIRSATYTNTVINLQLLRKSLNSFRIDGHCMTLDSPDHACSSNSYAVHCNEPIFDQAFSAANCRCYDAERNDSARQLEHVETTIETHVETTLSSYDSEPNSTNATVDSERRDLINETCETTMISCVPGSVASPCIPPGAQDIGYSGCYPTLLPCYFEENCLSENKCSSSGLLEFGEGAGDVRGEPADDEAFGPITVDIPIMYFNTPRSRLYVSTNCLVSLDAPYEQYVLCGNLPCAPEPLIAPIWTDLDFRARGAMFYRTSQDSVILDQIARSIADVNPVLSDYQPTQAVIVTWFEALSHFDDELTEPGDLHGTIQLVVSTDRKNSFASFVYTDPVTVALNLSDSEVSVIGFDGGDASGADFGAFLLQSNRELPRVNTFRIDGMCITTVLPGEACSLEAHTKECANFTATTCECDPGFEYNGVSCSDIDECLLGVCHDTRGECSNTNGSFTCACIAGYSGDGFDCRDVDECKLGLCGNFSACFNTVGNYTCVCNSGYRLHGQNKCIQEFRRMPGIGAILAIVFISLATLIAVTAVGATIYIKRRRRIMRSLLRPRVGAENMYRERLMKVNSSFKLDVSKSLMVNSCNLQLGKTLGQGEFGVVYQGLLKKRFQEKRYEVVAVKTLKGFMQKELVTKMLEECDVMKNFDHPNVLTLKGVCLDGGPAPFIIMPFMALGSLLNYLKENRESLVITSSSAEMDSIGEVQKRLLDICIQVGKGMEYLASKRFIHRDLAARNCMVDSGFVIKVADFGLSESMATSKDYFRLKGNETVKLPMKWLAIESINDGIFSEKTDVWAYGVTCWEVFSGGKTPYPGINPQDIARQLESGHRMAKPINAACTDRLYQIIMSCWANDSGDRPTFSQVVTHFSELLAIVAGYLDFQINKTATTST